ncbi:acetyl-CoA carboxylase biotin carboxylase subunit [Bacillus solimangrovi]|uniref:biotin carboxylase n=1 Tax=Bacillus solimangrovi TaxID=1305675 RepID=A0A1E5LJW4_9BACI|nr:acetyl-CoA carboxylase biotin carboxylase subunit [Bacillus solimangrovi]OEH94382.1 biotin carboxylase [Bacillus solimangrovi]
MFKKVLIANRGEIAARVIRTCKQLNIQTVAIYSEADADAPHVRMADEAVLIGKPRVNESYMQMDKVIETAKETGAEAIHPGYGLLSENIEFAKKCEAAGIVFIGPSTEAIGMMGSKIEARKAMDKAGVPIVPGIAEPVKDSVDAIKIANEMGYPVMLKASSGGGGIGMQIVRNDAELEKSFEGNQKRATMFFGDGAMYLEKYIANPRHIEIQILADKSGNTIYLFERECSIQRRHQKVIEEAPSSFLDEETRKKMGEAAVKAAKAINYENAGTIEFLVDEQKNFYFLEMNTRLQVEHPITEEITGIDLVEAQLNIAAGESLQWKQEDLQILNHSIEARIYAEDPKTFYPSPGKITALQLPEGPHIRHELAVHSQSQVTPFYDPMIAKLIVTAQTRTEAIEQMIKVLNDYHVAGIKTNIPMLKDVVSHEKFIEGETTTNFVDKYYLNTPNLQK